MSSIPLARQVGRVPSMVVPLDADGQRRFEPRAADLLIISLHQHTLVKPEAPADFAAYVATHDYTWGYQAVRAGGWTVVGAACNMTGLARGVEGSFITFEDLVTEIALMLADAERQPDVMRVSNQADIESARESGKIGLLPVAEHLAQIGRA